MTLIRKYTLAVILLFVIQMIGCIRYPQDQYVVTILSTDLSINKDPDDWFDLYAFLKTPTLNPVGIILDTYATDSVKEETEKFLRLNKINDLVIAKGIRRKIEFKGDRYYYPSSHKGAKYILETMKKSKGKVRLISVGSLRNEALAYETDSVLFMKKIDKLYFVAGNLQNFNETNIKRDLNAAKIILNSPIPKVWIPCSENLKLFLPGKIEERLEKRQDSVSKFLSDKLSEWRDAKPMKFFKKTGQYPLGKNLWSTAIFAKAANLLDTAMKFERGKIFMNFKQGRILFDKKSDGPDLLLVKRDEDSILNWFYALGPDIF